ncbi:hypothetical protein ATOBIA_N03710 [Atopobiaceae bacterium P1]|uniref:Uncharacterized protein n=1 Tax=Leptogranulimonas caecicola TaxID=2894156 RepID=A0AAU9C9F6_9ACTN|nr:hypothetical protein ATOBIA_N03710 [Atopobiaceae bacterium P1]BDC90487.1 hypothetical protein ATTO_03590 [Leptogranulimonas caecicola]
MGSSAHEREDHDVIGNFVYEQPVGSDMAFPVPGPIPGEHVRPSAAG